MLKTSRNNLLLAMIVGFSFVYRVLLMLRETYPPGADIGLHNSVIYSITQGGNTDFLYNFFHMGGGSSITFPGYHIFTAFVILFTGIQDYTAHALVASLFSSLIVAAAFLITRKVWNTPAALIVAFLCAVSRFDIEMLMWGGYPNVITLMLIPVAFYLFLEKNRLGRIPFLTSASLVCGSIFLTHSLSSVLFVTITLITVFLGTLFSRKVGERRLSLLTWLFPIIIGATLISPFLIQMAPAYLSADASTFTGGVTDIQQALVSTKILPLEIVIPLIACVSLFFLFSREYNGKFLSLPALLLFLWMLTPTLLTQGYLIGLYTSYDRFLYFVIFPMVMLIGLGFYHLARFFSNSLYWIISTIRQMPEYRTSKSKTLNRAITHLTRKNFATSFTLFFVLFLFLTIPLFMVPSNGIAMQSFYQLMNKPEYEAIDWAQKNTPANAVFLTDAQYGWWFSGFSKRSTISAVEPQYLANSREFEPAKAARYILDTNYLVDNGLIQIREDGGYIARHNPIFLAKLNNSYFPFPFFNIDNARIEISFRRGEDSQIPEPFQKISNLAVTDMHLEVAKDNSSAKIIVNRQNDFVSFNQTTTVFQGKRFADVNITVGRIDSTITFDAIKIDLPTKGERIQGENQTTVGYFDKYSMIAGQVIFTMGQPEPVSRGEERNGYLTIKYRGNAQPEVNIAFSVGVYSIKPEDDLFQIKSGTNLNLESPEKEWKSYFVQLLSYNAQDTTNYSSGPLDVFDYSVAIKDHGVSYIVLRDFEQVPRFAKDPKFSEVFNNDNVAIFKVLK
jgi:hypothetical protein